MFRRRIALVPRDAVLRVLYRQTQHFVVAVGLCQYGCSGNGLFQRIPADDARQAQVREHARRITLHRIERPQARKTGWAAFVGSAVLTVALYVVLATTIGGAP